MWQSDYRRAREGRTMIGMIMRTRRNRSRVGGGKSIPSALFIPVELAILFFFVLVLTQGHTAEAAAPRTSEDDIWLKCLETEVSEGDDFKLEVRKKERHQNPETQIRVYWYTDPGTADESDYEVLERERQVSNGHQSLNGRMGRTFHTRNDPYPEVPETYVVRFINHADPGDDGACTITILDNDPVGIYRLEITSEPQDGEAYTAGEVIEVTAHFTGRVSNIHSEATEPADYLGIHIVLGDESRLASLVRGNGTDTLVFGYEVQERDTDGDGISLEDGNPNVWPRTGWVYRGLNSPQVGLWSVDSGRNKKASLFYVGLDDDEAHRVVG